jgi:hypothetical protein
MYNTLPTLKLGVRQCFFQFFRFFQFCDVAKVVIIGRSIKPNLAIKDIERQKKSLMCFFVNLAIA